jgi:hypothetical protein
MMTCGLFFRYSCGCRLRQVRHAYLQQPVVSTPVARMTLNSQGCFHSCAYRKWVQYLAAATEVQQPE